MFIEVSVTDKRMALGSAHVYRLRDLKHLGSKYKWGVGSYWSYRKCWWRHENMGATSSGACGWYSHWWSCRSLALTFETWSE